jgi:hypothetical protein
MLSSASSESLEVTCELNDFSTHNMSCSNGEIVSLTCEGVAGVMQQHCPIHNSSTICSSLSSQTSNQVCSVLSESPENITCKCSMLPPVSFREQTVTGDGPVTMNFGVMVRSVSQEFFSDLEKC